MNSTTINPHEIPLSVLQMHAVVARILERGIELEFRLGWTVQIKWMRFEKEIGLLLRCFPLVFIGFGGIGLAPEVITTWEFRRFDRSGEVQPIQLEITTEIIMNRRKN